MRLVVSNEADGESSDSTDYMSTLYFTLMARSLDPKLGNPRAEPAYKQQYS